MDEVEDKVEEDEDKDKVEVDENEDKVEEDEDKDKVEVDENEDKVEEEEEEVHNSKCNNTANNTCPSQLSTLALHWKGQLKVQTLCKQVHWKVHCKGWKESHNANT